MLVHYIKKSQKAPKKEIKKAMQNIKVSDQINFQVDLIGKMIETREKKGLSQRDLVELNCKIRKHEVNAAD